MALHYFERDGILNLTGNANFATYSAQASPGFPYVSYDAVGDLWYLGDDKGLYDSSLDNYMAFEYTDPTGDEPVLLQSAAGVASSGGYQVRNSQTANQSHRLSPPRNSLAMKYLLTPSA